MVRKKLLSDVGCCRMCVSIILGSSRAVLALEWQWRINDNRARDFMQTYRGSRGNCCRIRHPCCKGITTVVMACARALASAEPLADCHIDPKIRVENTIHDMQTVFGSAAFRRLLTSNISTLNLTSTEKEWINLCERVLSAGSL